MGSRVGCYDYDRDAVEQLLKQANEGDKVDSSGVHGFSSLEKLPRILVLSLPHGKTVDKVAGELLPLLEKGDVIMDGGNEWWEETERRQKWAAEMGVEPSGSSWSVNLARAWEVVRPWLEKWAPRADGEPCVARIGLGGSGHYVKMVHNEQAHLSIICQVRMLLHSQVGLSNDEIANIFEAWHKQGPLRGNYLLGIGYKGLRFKHGAGIDDERGIVEGVEDKVTQDVDKSEGTGTWTVKEIGERPFVAAPAIAAAHQLRIISSDKFERLEVADNLQIPQPQRSKVKADDEFLRDVEAAVYGAVLGAFVQGLIAKASKEHGVSTTELLIPLLNRFGPNEPLNLLKSVPEVAKELSKTYQPLKKVYSLAIESDAVAPAIGATLEWLKCVGGRDLPTDFEELELDYFGYHNYDIKGQAEPGSEKGKHHPEFAPA